MLDQPRPNVVRVTTSITMDAKANGFREVKIYLVADLPKGPTVIGEVVADFQLREHLGMLAQSLSQFASRLSQDIVAPDGRALSSDVPASPL